MGQRGVEDVQEALTSLVPCLSIQLRAVADHKVLKAVCTRPSQLFVICGLLQQKQDGIIILAPGWANCSL